MQSLCFVSCLNALQTALYIDCMTASDSCCSAELLSIWFGWVWSVLTRQDGFSSCGPSDVLHQNQSLMRLTDLIRVVLIAGRVHQRCCSLCWSSVLLYMTENTCEVTQRLQKGKRDRWESQACFTACDQFSTHMSRSHFVDKADALGEELVTGYIRGQQPVTREQLGQTISDHCTSGAADSDTWV